MKVIKYGANWCTPCKDLDKMLSALGIEFKFVDIDKEKIVLAKKGLNSIPFLEIYDDSDKLLGRVIGCPDSTTILKNKINKILEKNGESPI